MGFDNDDEEDDIDDGNDEDDDDDDDDSALNGDLGYKASRFPLLQVSFPKSHPNQS